MTFCGELLLLTATLRGLAGDLEPFDAADSSSRWAIEVQIEA